MGAEAMSARYLTSDPTQSLALTRDGRPHMDFAAAPSLFLEEDIRQENLLSPIARRCAMTLRLRRSTKRRLLPLAPRLSASPKPRLPRSAPLPPVLPRPVRSRSGQSSSVPPSRLPTPMLRCRPVPPLPAPKSFVRCSRVLVLSRSVRRQSARQQQQRRRMRLPRLVVLRPPLSRPAGHRTAHTARGSRLRLRLTELHRSPRRFRAVVVT